MKRITLLKTLTIVFFLMMGVGNALGQTNPGDIAFIAANADGDDDFAFVTLVDIPASANIYFTDNEWNGSAFTDLNEGELTWTNGASILSAGSIVVFTDPKNSSTRSVNVGSVSGAGWDLGASDEWFYALLSAPATSYSSTPVFLAALASDAGSGWLTGTGLTEGTSAIDFNNDYDGFLYTGSRSGQSSFSNYLSLIYNSSNWTNQSSDGELIIPISATAFTITGGSGPNNPTALNISQTTSDKMQITWTKPSGTFGTDWDGVVVFVSDGSNGIDLSKSSGEDGIDYSPDLNYGDGSLATDASETDLATCVANQTTDLNGEITITGLTDGNIYYVYAYAYKEVTGDNDDDEWSSEVDGGSVVAEVQGTSDFAASAGNEQVELTWINPGGQGSFWDNVLVLAKSGGAVDAIPSGDGTGYTANATYGSGTEIGTGNYVVYKGTGTNVTVTGLTNGTNYHFKTFVNDGTSWTPVGQSEIANATPVAIPKVFFSEYIEGSSNNKAVEIYNGENSSIDLTLLTVNLYSNGSASASNSWTGSAGTLNSGETYVLYNSSAVAAVSSVGNETSTIANYNGDDALELIYDGVTTDIIGVIGSDPGSSWIVAGSGATAENTLIRKLSIIKGETDWSTSAGTDASDSEWVVMPQDYFGNLGFYGSVFSDDNNTDWNTAANWDLGIPASNSDALIPTGENVIISETTEASVNNLTVNGSLTIKSLATNTGSLIINGTATGNITAERYIAAASDWINANDGWHLLSSPVASQAISGDWTPDGSSSNDYDFYKWDESQQLYLNQKLPANNINTFDPGVGYFVAYEATATPEFTGAPNTTSQTENLTLSGAPAVDKSYGYNLLGNPFQSAIDWSHASWDKTGVGGVAKIWNNGAFIDIDDDPSIIPAMNGFFVSTSSNNNSFTIPAEARVHNSQNWYKSVSNNTIKLIAKDIEGNLQQESRIRFNEAATAEFDQAFDGPFMTGYAPLFYSTDETHLYSTNTLPEFNDQLEIPFGFVKNTSSSFEIELAQSIEGVIVYLTDFKSGVQHNLTESAKYSFTASKGDNPNRFLLHFGVVGLDENDTESSLRAYTYNNMLYVQNSLEAANLRILDMQGRLLLDQQLNGQGLQSLPLDFPAGVYVVQLVNSKAQKSVKVIVE